jgi:hypothetical protein
MSRMVERRGTLKKTQCGAGGRAEDRLPAFDV